MNLNAGGLDNERFGTFHSAVGFSGAEMLEREGIPGKDGLTGNLAAGAGKKELFFGAVCD